MNEKIREKIINYFGESNSNLEILDENDSDKTSYSGVTAEYIIKYVVGKEFDRNDVIDELVNLHTKKKLKALKCENINNIVFHKVSNNWDYDLNRDCVRYPQQHYAVFVNHMNSLKKIK